MEKVKKIMLWFGIVFALAVVLHFLFAYFEWRDSKVEINSDRYEACVRATYQISPAGYYEENGVYPECDYQVND